MHHHLNLTHFSRQINRLRQVHRYLPDVFANCLGWGPDDGNGFFSPLL
jgi:hypothetical protein